MLRRTRRPVTWLAILAMLVHAFLPLAHAAAGSRGVLVTLCSIDGSRQIFVPTADADGKQGGEGSPAMAIYKCPLCMAGAHVALAGEWQPGVVNGDWLDHVQYAAPAMRVLPPQPWLHAAPRAPPASLRLPA